MINDISFAFGGPEKSLLEHKDSHSTFANRHMVRATRVEHPLRQEEQGISIILKNNVQMKHGEHIITVVNFGRWNVIRLADGYGVCIRLLISL
jgi:hypothetical protein